MSSNDAGALLPLSGNASPAMRSGAWGTTGLGAAVLCTVEDGLFEEGEARSFADDTKPAAAPVHAALLECASKLDADELVLMSDDDVVALTQQLEQASRLVNALLVRLSGALDVRSDPHLEESLAKKAGCRNTIELLQRLSQRSSSSLGRRLQVARATRAEVGISGSPIPPVYPAVEAALAAGHLPEESALQIIRALKSLPSRVGHEQISIAERSIVAQAAGYCLNDDGETGDPSASDTPLPQDCDTVRLICDRWCAYLDQDGKAPSEEETMANRYFRLGREKNGLVPAHGLLTPDTAALVGNLFFAINSPLTATNTEDLVDSTTSALPGSGVRFVEAELDPQDRFSEKNTSNNSNNSNNSTIGTAKTGERTHGQKVHDALRMLAEIAARAAETPQLRGTPVTVLIQTTQEDLAHSLQQDFERLAALAATETLGGSPASTNDSRVSPGTAWLHGHDGTPSPVSMAVARHGICTGATQRVLTGSRGEILGIDSPTRTFTPHQRRAITARDGGCIIPGCTVPAPWCEVHHVTEWSRGGPTSTDNGVLLCWYHHRNIDSNGWHIRMVEGLPEVLAPPWIDPHQRWRRERPPLRTNPVRVGNATHRDGARSSLPRN